MRWEHTLRWYCRVGGCGNLVFDELKSFEGHMELFHQDAYSTAQLPMLAESTRRPALDIFEHCPLCNYIPEASQSDQDIRAGPNSTNKANLLHRHIATHLESLALLSLPWQNDDDDQTSSGKKTQSKGKRSTFKNAGIGGADEISLNFDDPPIFGLLEEENHSTTDKFPLDESSEEFGEGQWDFIPLIPYDGHLQDPRLQGMIRTHLETQSASRGRRDSGDADKTICARGKLIGDVRP